MVSLAGTHGDDGEAGVDGEVGVDDHEATVVERAYAAENAAETPQIGTASTRKNGLSW